MVEKIFVNILLVMLFIVEALGLFHLVEVISDLVQTKMPSNLFGKRGQLLREFRPLLCGRSEIG